jgi:hypothetical protein
LTDDDGLSQRLRRLCGERIVPFERRIIGRGPESRAGAGSTSGLDPTLGLFWYTVYTVLL